MCGCTAGYPDGVQGSVESLTFVYDADGTLAGELRYWFGTLFGAPHCSLCDVTHTRWGKRRAFRRCADRVGLPIEYLHRDDLSASIRAIAGPLPVVLGHAGGTTEVLLSREELADLHGDVTGFEARLRAALAARDRSH